MSNTFVIGIYVLILGNVIACGGIFLLLYLVLKRQQEGMRYLLKQMQQSSMNVQKTDSKTTQLSIPVDEPIAKYEKVSLPDDVKIDFIKD